MIRVKMTKYGFNKPMKSVPHSCSVAGVQYQRPEEVHSYRTNLHDVLQVDFWHVVRVRARGPMNRDYFEDIGNSLRFAYHLSEE